MLCAVAAAADLAEEVEQFADLLAFLGWVVHLGFFVDEVAVAPTASFAFEELAVPWFVFGLFFLPFYMRMVRVRLLETYTEPYISTARAKGASELRVLRHHALRNALSGAAGGFDLPLTAGIVIVVGAFVVLFNLAPDVAEAVLDPRIRHRTASGLIPLPRAIDARPRVRLALNIAFAVSVAALLAVAIAHPGARSATTARLVPPVHTVKLGSDDVTRIEGMVTTPNSQAPVLGHGYLEAKASTIEIGKQGWRVRATLANVGSVPVRVAASAPPGTPVVYPNEPFSLIVRTDNGGGIKQLIPLPATTFAPDVPKTLEPGTTWRGTSADPTS